MSFEKALQTTVDTCFAISDIHTMSKGKIPVRYLNNTNGYNQAGLFNNRIGNNNPYSSSTYTPYGSNNNQNNNGYGYSNDYSFGSGSGAGSDEAFKVIEDVVTAPFKWIGNALKHIF